MIVAVGVDGWKWVIPMALKRFIPRWPSGEDLLYGFNFYKGRLHLYWGSCGGKGSHIIIFMPWHWRECRKETEPETYDYTYKLKSGGVQYCKATIVSDGIYLRRWWIPSKKSMKFISITFDREIGENTGLSGGGVVGCDYNILKGETLLDALRRMELEQKF